MPLTTRAYPSEHLRRGQLAGCPLVAQFHYREFRIFGRKPYLSVEDRFMDFLRARGALPAGQFDAYLQALRDAFPDLVRTADWTNEALYAACEAVRTAFLNERLTEEERRAAWALSWSGAFARTLEQPSPEAGYDQRGLEDTLLARAGRAVVYVGDGEWMGEAVLRAKNCLKDGKRVTVLASSGARGHIPDRAFWAEALGPDGAGVEFRLLEAASSTLDVAALDLPAENALLLGYGEDALLTLHSLVLPAFVKAVPRCFYAGLLAGNLTAPGVCHCHIPAGFSMYPYAPVTEKARLSYRHLARLYARYGERVYAMPLAELYRLDPARFAVPFEDSASWSGARPSFEWQGEGFAAFDGAAHSALMDLVGGLPGVKALSGYYDGKTLEPAPVPFERMRSVREGAPMEPLDARAFPGVPMDTPITASAAEGIFVTGAILGRVEDARVLLSNGAAISPRAEFHKRGREHPEAVWLASNFLFFLTPRLFHLYNRLRLDRPQETLKRPRGHIDYRMLRTPEGRVETFPLFRKACLGMRRDGTFALFHFALGGGAVAGDGFRIAWQRGDVNPQQPYGPIAVYTPDASRDDHPEDHRAYRRLVGEGRLNLVLVDDEIACVRMGDVVLPSIGVVVSISAEASGECLRQMACALGGRDAQGYYEITKEKVRVELDPPEGFTPESWADLAWAYGGGLTLVEDGKAVFGADSDASALLAAEGWMTPLSRQMQESDIHALARHPRTAVGQTADGKLFVLVFSGRTNFSAGADYREMCAIAAKLVPDIACMMNVDGGGSSLFGIAMDGGFAEISYPAPSDTTCAGLCRPVNTLLVLRVR